MIDINTLTEEEKARFIYRALNINGITNNTDTIPALFKCGVGYDSESTTITHNEVVKIGKKDHKRTIVDYCFNYAYQISITKDAYIISRTKYETMRFLRMLVNAVKAYNVSRGTNAILIIWCANLSHEWSFVKRELYKDFEITKTFAKSPRDVLYIQLENCVEFRECIGLFGHSLDDIAKHWCSKDNQKLTGTFDYTKIRTSETALDNKTELPYMIQDVRTLAEMHTNVLKYYTQKDGVCCLPYTSSGFVRLKLKAAIRDNDDLTEEREATNERRKKPIKTNIEYLKIKNSVCVIDSYQWHICRDFSYAGGLCGSNIKYVGKILKDVVCADLTSDYPAQLTHKKYPYGALKRCEGNLNDVRRELDKKKIPYFAILKIKSMHAKTSHAVFSKHKILNLNSGLFIDHGAPRDLIIYNGKVKSGKNLIVCWNDVDIKAYSELYDIKAGVLTLWKFDRYAPAPRWLLETMWGDYETKSKLKAENKHKDPDFKQLYDDSKRDVNTYYGVLATRLQNTYDALDECLQFISSKEKTFKQVKYDFWLNPYIAFYCTSYARATLMHFIARYPDAIVQYDTDSLYYIKSKGKDLEKALQEYNETILNKNKFIFRERDTKELFYSLGQWDFDETYEKFMGLGAKKYIKQVGDKIETVIAGLPKDAIPKEISERGINEPFNYYNPLVKWLKERDKNIIIDNIFAHKFASVYDDTAADTYAEITDYNGKMCKQEVSTYHAIVPIDFTLSLAIDFIRQIIKER